MVITSRFQADDRLLELLVGSNLYPNAEVAVRELVQNAQDAIEWRRSRGDGGGGVITVRFSQMSRYFEVQDDGIGMDREDIDNHFLRVGRDKLDALDSEAAAGEQVAYFGIGVLSVFMVAKAVKVHTRKVNGGDRGLTVDIPSLSSEVTIHEGQQVDEPGTTIRVDFRSESAFEPSQIPEILKTHVRHVPSVFIEDVDSGTREPLQESWDVSDLNAVADLPRDQWIRAGRLGFSGVLTGDSGAISNGITLSNAGFLVEQRALDLLPLSPAGFEGELDLHPRVLNIVMSRERYQRDEQWKALGDTLAKRFCERAITELRDGFLRATGRLDSRSVRQAILIWFSLLPKSEEFSELIEELRQRLLNTVPFQIYGRQQASLRAVIEESPAPRLYYRRLGQPGHVSQRIKDDGISMRVDEELSIAVTAEMLRARRFSIVDSRRIDLTLAMAKGARGHVLEEFTVIRDALAEEGVEVRDISDVLEEDRDLRGVRQSPELTGLFVGLESRLVFASIPDSQRRVLADPTGIRYINVNHQEVKRLLKVVPAAIANPLKRRLLDAYLSLESYQIADGRDKLMEILELEDFGELAGAQTAVLSHDAVELLIASEFSADPDETIKT